MSINILGFNLGGEAQKKKAATNAYEAKYPIQGDINELRQNLGRATIELSDLKSQKPQTSSQKAEQQRNINALSAQTINLQNAINDANLGMGNSNNNYLFQLPSADTLLLKTTYVGGTLEPKTKKSTVIVGGLPGTMTKEVVDNTDGGQPQVDNTQPQGAKGDYPPPQGVQGFNYGKWIGLGLLGIGVVTIGYILLSKKK
jgi:hypothetical protein